MLAQSGMRTAFRLLSQSASHGRSIHIPSNAFTKKLPLPPGGASSSKGKGVIDTARNAIARLLYGVQPISSSGHPHAFRRAIHTHTTQPIRNQFSFPVRHALSNSPLSFARPPAVQRGMTEVGLGTARKFSTTRPIFQNLIQNVPVAGRSLYEMDLDVQKRKAKRIAAKKLALDNDSSQGQKLKVDRSTLENFNKYFPVESADEDVSTVLTVPLIPFDAPAAPTSSFNEQTFLPMNETARAFQSHGNHRHRVANLFRKLDKAKVWDRGAHYEAFGSASTSIYVSPVQSALCSSLRVVFDGWTAADVLSIIGEDGLSWCNLQESKVRTSTGYEGPHSLESSRAVSPNVWDQPPEFIMPSMDFSSSFLDHTDVHSPGGRALGFEDVAVLSSGPSTPWFSDISLPSTRPGSAFGDYEVEDEWSLAPQATARPQERNEAGIAFSAEFLRRGQDMDVWSNF